MSKKKVIQDKKIMLQTREEIDIILPPKLHPLINIQLKIKLSWLPKNVKLYVLGRDGKWTCKGNANTPFRVNRKNGNTECMSVNAKDCLVANPRSCKDLKISPPRRLKPLECGKDHMKIWGMTGYEGAGHWCNTFRNLYLDNAKAVLVNEKTHETIATGAMKGSKFYVKKVYPEFDPLFNKVHRAMSQNPHLLDQRKDPV